MQDLYTRYPIVARRAWPTGCIGRVRRASKGILHTNARYLCSRDALAARPSARATIGYLVYKPDIRSIPKLYHYQSEIEWNLKFKIINPPPLVINRKHLEASTPSADYVNDPLRDERA